MPINNHTSRYENFINLQFELFLAQSDRIVSMRRYIQLPATTSFQTGLFLGSLNDLPERLTLCRYSSATTLFDEY